MKLAEYANSATAIVNMRVGDGCVPDFRLDTGRCSDVLRYHTDASVDVVITSPPYYGVTDYVRSQRLTFLWLDEQFEPARQAESGARFKRRRSGSLADFLEEMSQSFLEIARVLRPRRHCAVMIGESPHRASYVEQFERVLSACGLSVEDRIQRRLPRQRTLSPQLQTERLILCRNTYHG